MLGYESHWSYRAPLHQGSSVADLCVILIMSPRYEPERNEVVGITQKWNKQGNLGLDWTR